MRVAVAGKGGAGKSLIAATLARLVARRGHRVLALDTDPLGGLALRLGVDVPAEAPLLAAAERGDDGRWRFVRGVGPVRVVQRYSTEAPDGVRCLQVGSIGPGGRVPIGATSQAFHMTVHRLDRAVALRDWVIVGDLVAGARQIAFDWAPYAERLLLVVEPTWQSMLTARRIQRVALSARPTRDLCLVVNKCRGDDDPLRVGAFLSLPVLAAVPVDDAVRSAERFGVALLDHAPDAPAVEAVERLADCLIGTSIDAHEDRGGR
jgi:CO dehydrogenase maturation factor